MKTILFALALLLVQPRIAAAFAALEIAVTRATVLGEAVEASASAQFQGTLSEFRRAFFDSESSNGQLTYKIHSEDRHLTSAKAVARLVWRDLFGQDARTMAPFPCGYQRHGEITESGFAESGLPPQHTIRGEGEGGSDTCTGRTGPGYWRMKLVVTYDEVKRTGLINYDVVEE